MSRRGDRSFVDVGRELSRRRGQKQVRQRYGLAYRVCNLCKSDFMSTAPLRHAGPYECRRGATCPDCLMAYRIVQAECDGLVPEEWYDSRRPHRGPGTRKRVW